MAKHSEAGTHAVLEAKEGDVTGTEWSLMLLLQSTEIRSAKKRLIQDQESHQRSYPESPWWKLISPGLRVSGRQETQKARREDSWREKQNLEIRK